MRSGYSSKELLGETLLAENPNVGNHFNVDQVFRLGAFSDEPLMDDPLEFLPDLQATPGHGLRVH